MSAKNEKRPFRKKTGPQKTQRPVHKKRKSTAIFPRPQAPEGYVFVPKGDVYITRRCTTLTQEAGQVVHIVYNNNTKSKTRIGLHIPQTIWTTVEADAASTASQRASAVQRKDDRDRTKARTALKENYPSMPPVDIEQVLNHAFMKGSGRVGRTSGQSEEQRASLAVGAHVRHNYTAYDKLLKEMSREDARNQVRKRVRDVKTGWTSKACVIAVRSA